MICIAAVVGRVHSGTEACVQIIVIVPVYKYVRTGHSIHLLAYRSVPQQDKGSILGKVDLIAYDTVISETQMPDHIKQVITYNPNTF